MGGLRPADWVMIVIYTIGMLGMGLFFAKRSTRSANHFLVADRKLPWWVIGFSNVAAYSDAGGMWAAIYFTGAFMLFNFRGFIAWPIWMPLVAILWSKMWRRSRLVTTGELLEFRYSGKAAAVFRGFYGVYACLFWATLLIGYNMIFQGQIIAPFLGPGWNATNIVVFFTVITLIYTLMSGIFGATYLDVPMFFIFIIAAAVIFVLSTQTYGGYSQLVDQAIGRRGEDFFQIYPPASGTRPPIDGLSLFAFVILGLMFPGHPFAGEGWTAQKFLAAKDERHAALGQMFNCVLSLSVRVIPFLPLGMIAIALFPAQYDANGDVTGLILPDGSSHSQLEAWSQVILPLREKLPGLIGFMLAAFLAGYMSSICAFLQWGSSFVINDLYRRHLRPRAPDREHIWVARAVMIAMIGLATIMAIAIPQRNLVPWVGFIGAALVLPALPLAWLRWFWWRLNIWGEIFALAISTPLAYYLWFIRKWTDASGIVHSGWSDKPFWQPSFLLLGVGAAGTVLLSLIIGPESRDTLKRFYLRVRPPGFWGPIKRELEAEGLIDADLQRKEFRLDVVAALCGIVFCFGLIFMAYTIVALRWQHASAWLGLALVAGYFHFRCWTKSHALAKEADRAATEREKIAFAPAAENR